MAAALITLAARGAVADQCDLKRVVSPVDTSLAVDGRIVVRGFCDPPGARYRIGARFD